MSSRINQWTVLFVLLVNTVLQTHSAPYHQNQYHNQQDYIIRQQVATPDEPRQVGQLLTGLVGSAVGAVASPLIGGITPVLGNLIGNAIGEAINSAATMALTNLSAEDLLGSLRDQDSLPMKTYVINIPDVGPYVVMVKPNKDEEAKEEEEGDVSRPAYPGTESKLNSVRSEKDVRRVQILPYKTSNVQFLKSN